MILEKRETNEVSPQTVPAYLLPSGSSKLQHKHGRVRIQEAKAATIWGWVHRGTREKEGTQKDPQVLAK